MKAKQIIEIIEKHYPLSLQEEWDKCGLQVGNDNQEINKIMISLDADLTSLQETIDNGCQMLITHHPFLLETIHNVSNQDHLGQFIYKAIENNIVVYSSHTALDKVSMNQWLIEALGVHDIQNGDSSGITKIAKLNQPMSKEEFIQHVKECYQLEHFKYAGDTDTVQTVAICGGSGAEFMDEFVGKADAYLTGDTKYRHAKAASDKHILLLDINHHSENIMVRKLKELLEKKIDLEIVEGRSLDYYTYL